MDMSSCVISTLLEIKEVQIGVREWKNGFDGGKEREFSTRVQSYLSKMIGTI